MKPTAVDPHAFRRLRLGVAKSTDGLSAAGLTGDPVAHPPRWLTPPVAPVVDPARAARILEQVLDLAEALPARKRGPLESHWRA